MQLISYLKLKYVFLIQNSQVQPLKIFFGGKDKGKKFYVDQYKFICSIK